MAQKPENTGHKILPILDIPTKGKMKIDARYGVFPGIESFLPPDA